MSYLYRPAEASPAAFRFRVLERRYLEAAQGANRTGALAALLVTLDQEARAERRGWSRCVPLQELARASVAYGRLVQDGQGRGSEGLQRFLAKVGLPDAPPPPAQPEDCQAQQQAAEQEDQSLLSELLSSPEVLRGLMAHPFVPDRTDADRLATSSLGGPLGQGMRETQNSNLHGAGRGQPAPTSTAHQQRYPRGNRNQLNRAQQPSNRPLHKPLHGTGPVARQLKCPTEKGDRGRNMDIDDDSDYLKALRAKNSRATRPLKRGRYHGDEYDSQDSSPDENEFQDDRFTDSSPEKARPKTVGGFRSARAALKPSRKFNSSLNRGSMECSKKSNTRRLTRAVLGPRRKFSPPKRINQKEKDADSERKDLPDVPNVEPRLLEMILNEVIDKSPGVEWEDIAGLEFAKKNITEAVIWPMLRPDIFTGLRGPPKGLLLFGPPGTGKTMIGRAIASRSGATFFNISASSLTSKWVGEGEKMVRALFGVARVHQPAVIFIDEIDSLLTQRTDGDQEASRRIKTEFLVQMDGAATSKEDRILVVGATNRPQELDEAARRRLVKRLYIPLPDESARKSLVARLLAKQRNDVSERDIQEIANLTAGYSGSDMYALCAEAALGPVRDLGASIQSISVDSVRPINLSDFSAASRLVRASVSKNELVGYQEWNSIYGSFPNAD